MKRAALSLSVLFALLLPALAHATEVTTAPPSSTISPKSGPVFDPCPGCF